jgi:hypothetical protein
MSCKSIQAQMDMHQAFFHSEPSLNLTTPSTDEQSQFNSTSPHESDAMPGPVLGGLVTPEEDAAAEAADIVEYCLGCYWPFVDMIINEALSDAFWCEHRGVLNGTEEVPTSETALTDLLHTDVSFVACMENVRLSSMLVRSCISAISARSPEHRASHWLTWTSDRRRARFSSTRWWIHSTPT